MKERILHILCRLIFIVAACPIDASALSSTDVTICNEYNEKSGIATETERDRLGRVTSQITRHNRRRLTEKEYIWGLNDQLLSITNNGKQTLFEYDGWGNLAKATYPDGKVEHRNPDRIGNLYASADKKDRKYGAGGRLEEDAEHFYHYDDEGNLIYKELRQFQEGVVNYNRKEEEQELNIKFRSTGTGWRYDWQSNGMLARVIRPDEQVVHFRYDALGRRTAKVFKGMVTRWIWDGNVPLHEWEYKAKDLQVAQDQQPPVEPTEDVTTWVFEAGTFVPAAKLKGDKRYSIVTDYLGTPIQMYDEQGEKTWDCTLDVYGKVATFEGSSLRECPFRYQGQYEDEETGLYYNRFRYYDSSVGAYLSQDPIGLAGNNPTLYSYVPDPNMWLDQFGLEREPIIFLPDGGGVVHPGTISSSHPHGVFTIDATGSYFDDRKALADAANISDPGKNWRAHHIGYDQKTNTMQIQFVHKDYHSYSHIGGADEFKQNTGFKYGSDEAMAEANKRNKEKIKSCKG